jgi:hypothetical protein
MYVCIIRMMRMCDVYVCMNVCMYLDAYSMHIHMHVHDIYIYIHTYTHTYVCVCICIYICVCVYIYTHTHTHGTTPMVCMCLCLCVCVCVFVLTQTQVQTRHMTIIAAQHAVCTYKSCLFIRSPTKTMLRTPASKPCSQQAWQLKHQNACQHIHTVLQIRSMRVSQYSSRNSTGSLHPNVSSNSKI